MTPAGTIALTVDPEDVAPRERARVEEVLRTVALAEVRDPDAPAFHEVFDLLDAFFGPSGEMESREALADFVRARRLDYAPGLSGTYHLIGAWHAGTLVGARDCYVDVDAATGVCVVALAHVFVAPAWRRTGLASVLRALPSTLARAVLTERFGAPLPTLVVAEMEPADAAEPDTLLRLCAYGRSGFAVLDPRRLPYSQPEFRDLPDARHTGIPLLMLLRTTPAFADGVPASMAESLPRLFYAAHRLHTPAVRVDPSEAHVLGVLRRSDAPVSLLPLPESLDAPERLAPLRREVVLPLYPPGLRGPERA